MVDVSNPALAEAYNDVRNDKSETTWAIFGYSSPTAIGLQAKGSSEWSEFVSHFKEDQAQFGFVRVTTGDSESKRAKFVFISWVGTAVSPLKRAKVSVHKASVKEVVRDYAVEVYAEQIDELDYDKVLTTVIKAGGANYGSGQAR